jgi:hypothetical protein
VVAIFIYVKVSRSRKSSSTTQQSTTTPVDIGKDKRSDATNATTYLSMVYLLFFDYFIIIVFVCFLIYSFKFFFGYLAVDYFCDLFYFYIYYHLLFIS